LAYMIHRPLSAMAM